MSITQRLKRLFGTKIQERLTLTDFLTLLAEKPTRRNRKLFYQRLLFSKVGTRIPNPDGSIKAGTRATTADDNVAVPSTQDSDGNLYLFVFCNVPAMWAAFPHDTFAELNARVVLEMAHSQGMGVIVQNVLESAKPWVRVPKADVADILAGRYSTNTVVVPPDHKVVVVHAQAVACLEQVESGVWVADLGSGAGLDDVVSGVRQLKNRGWKARVHGDTSRLRYRGLRARLRRSRVARHPWTLRCGGPRHRPARALDEATQGPWCRCISLRTSRRMLCRGS
jgi:hypothetical protein